LAKIGRTADRKTDMRALTRAVGGVEPMDHRLARVGWLMLPQRIERGAQLRRPSIRPLTRAVTQ
jgi:hypothetical protein